MPFVKTAWYDPNAGKFIYKNTSTGLLVINTKTVTLPPKYWQVVATKNPTGPAGRLTKYKSSGGQPVYVFSDGRPFIYNAKGEIVFGFAGVAGVRASILKNQANAFVNLPASPAKVVVAPPLANMPIEPTGFKTANGKNLFVYKGELIWFPTEGNWTKGKKLSANSQLYKNGVAVMNASTYKNAKGVGYFLSLIHI